MGSIGSWEHFMLQKVLEGAANTGQVERACRTSCLHTPALQSDRVPASVCSAACRTCLSCAKAAGPSGQPVQGRKQHDTLGARGTKPPNTKGVSKCWYFYPKRWGKGICYLVNSPSCLVMLKSFSDRFPKPLFSCFLLFLLIVLPLI